MKHEHHLRTREVKRVYKEHGNHRPRMNAIEEKDADHEKEED